MRDTRLEHAVLSFANLEQADLSSAKLGEANLTGAILKGNHPAGRRLEEGGSARSLFDRRGFAWCGTRWGEPGERGLAGCFRNHGDAGLFRFARARGIDGPGFGGGSASTLRHLTVAVNQESLEDELGRPSAGQPRPRMQFVVRSAQQVILVPDWRQELLRWDTLHRAPCPSKPFRLQDFRW